MTFVHVIMSKCQAFLVENDDEKGSFSGAHLPSITLEAEAGKSLSSRLAWTVRGYTEKLYLKKPRWGSICIFRTGLGFYFF